MPVAKRATRRQTVGSGFKAGSENRPVGRAFQQKVTDKLPPIVLFDRASLSVLRPLAERHGWPRHSKIGDALAKAQMAGHLSLAPLLEHFGAVELTRTSFMVLPVLDGQEEADAGRTFRCGVHAGRVVVYPPGADVSVPPTAETPPLHLSIVFFPFGGRQEDALAAVEFEVLFGGAKGGAKTEYIVAAAARQVDRPAYKALLFRKTEGSIEEVRARAKAMYEPLGAVYNVESATFTFPSGAKIELGFCAVEADADQYQGREFGFVGGDEFTQVADRKVRDRLISETRCKDPEVIRMIRWTANPIGPGVALMKKIFISVCGQDGSRVYHDEYDIEGLGKVRLARRFIPSRVTDNPVYKNDPGYMAVLHSLPDRLKRLLLHGDWSAALGVSLDELSRAKHWVPPGDPRLPHGIQRHWPRLGFLDWGFTHRWCFIIIAIDEQKNAWVEDTLWGSRDYVEDIAARIWAWIGAGEKPPGRIYASKLCFAKRSAEGEDVPTYAEQFAKARLPMMETNEDPGSRIIGLNNLRQWLAWQHVGPGGGEGEPRLRMIPTHGNEILFQQLEQMVPDPDNPEDVLKVDYDPDADENGINISGDDGYDTLKMFALMRAVAAKEQVVTQPKRGSYDHQFDKIMKERERAMSPGKRPF